MNRYSGFRAAAVAGLIALLLAMGAALRPWLPVGTVAAAPVLTATEIGFVQDMVAHHSQAIVLVQRLDRGADPSVVALAGQIADTQRTELGMLLGWLRLAGAPVTVTETMAWMRPRGAHRHAGVDLAHHHSTMPGMATTAELDELATARGGRAEVLFLRLMQRHHYGGIEMAAAADALLDGGEVERAARDMITGQGREAGLLGLLLDSRA
ncbi:DUF305 domain-containing protein [Nocardia sp. NPDC060259]|uniref:DUF305 domain-containing protein n=1 Tax=Nocardia sp. NPDC060259 TaxID=3347088 RepID=UPI0036537F1C